MNNGVTFGTLVGKTLTSIEGKVDSDEVIFIIKRTH